MSCVQLTRILISLRSVFLYHILYFFHYGVAINGRTGVFAALFTATILFRLVDGIFVNKQNFTKCVFIDQNLKIRNAKKQGAEFSDGKLTWCKLYPNSGW